ncbi:MAG: peptide ABC transporter substrate-binding protein [Gammaproteobacteria bacterium]|nr:peptide ABC transporter substrate-binding protein [Gammaproteobacteria bacterium]MDP7154676.1 peptide ABC transporter substrate-binding protein [Gammaproteobacteria bacterium]MDP7295851.1 peptide ABC transporter substrate-binding protein [Gammaproteobacteria bacterium]MDP7419727.1 peptide ABC transporter substrate-binding protein [Gammaproteobacteria bacterium]MDP7661099.1 peptide ABC transporter substrate-binding protein [Gammaproteobacteria bacterium]
MPGSISFTASVSLACLAIVAALLGGCGGNEAGSPQAAVEIGGPSGTELAADQTLHVGNGTGPQTLDPHRAEGVPSANILRDLFEGLTIEAPDGSIVPGVAKSWDISADGLVYTFHLHDDAKWSNGDPLTAEDFVFSLRRSTDPATMSHYSSILEPIVNAMEVITGEKSPEELGVEALDALTLVIRLQRPTAYLLGLLTHSTTYPVHRASVGQYGNQFAREGRLIGNGAYTLDEWVVQSHIKLIRNKFYRDNAATTIDSVYYYSIENQDAELKRFRADELDITEEIPYQQLPWIRENLADQLVISPYLGSYYFGFNMTREPFKNNLQLRRALSLAIDRDIITSRITNAGEIPAYGWVPQMAGYKQVASEWAGWTQAERNAEAQRLYSEAGYSIDKPLKIELLYNTSANHKRLSVAIASMWKQTLGVETKLLNQEWKVFLATRKLMKITQIFRAGWIGDYNDVFTFAQLMHSANEMNHSGYSSSRYDELIERAADETDLQARADFLNQAEHVLLEDMPIIPIYFYVSKHLIKSWVGGRQPNIMDHHYTKNFYILQH